MMKDPKQIAKDYVGKLALEGHAEFAITKAIEEDRTSRHAVLSEISEEELSALAIDWARVDNCERPQSCILCRANGYEAGFRAAEKRRIT